MIDRNIKILMNYLSLDLKLVKFVLQEFFDKYYMSLAEIKNLINNETFFAQAV